MTAQKLIEAIEATPARSAWRRGVKLYAVELLENLPAEIEYSEETRAALLNGARDWQQYSQGGCSLIYDGDIADRLCSPSELKNTRNGERNPNARETWLVCQARALSQARGLIMTILRAEVIA